MIQADEKVREVTMSGGVKMANVDTSAQRALAGLAYVLMHSASDGTALAETFVPADPPTVEIPEVEPAVEDDGVQFVDLDDQAGAIDLDDPSALAPHEPAVVEPEFRVPVYEEPAPAAALPQDSPVEVSGGWSAGAALDDWDFAASDPEPLVVAEAPAPEPERTGPMISTAGADFGRDVALSSDFEVVSEDPEPVIEAPEVIESQQAMPTGPAERNQGAEINYQQGGYRGAARRGVFADLDFIE